MKNQDHLPIYGVGPLYVGAVAGATLAAFLIRRLPLFASGRLDGLRAPLMVLGILFILSGAALWVCSVVFSKIDDGIRENRLVTAGAYTLVRNPIYSAAMLICDGVILMTANAWFFFLMPLYWLFMTVLMKATEEKWLKDLYGQEYEDYCRHVNRCWPCWPKGK